MVSSQTNAKNIATINNNQDAAESIALDNNEEVSDSLDLREFFVDSLTVGKKGNNKLEARLFAIKDSIYIVIEFFALENGTWELKNHFKFEKDGISGIDPKLSDFNNDSFLDFNYKATIAARGANNVRRLFIYSVEGDSLILIKNSLEYPNMVYNSKLDCVDAWLIHGCSSQAFLKLEKDSLIEFAWIQLSDRVSVYEIDKNRNEILIFRDTTNQYGCYKRFENFKPLVEYIKYPDE